MSLDSGSDATATYATYENLNGGAGNWDGATFTINRVTANGSADANTKDLFYFTSSSVFDLQWDDPFSNGSQTYLSQSVADAITTQTNATGALNDSILTGLD